MDCPRISWRSWGIAHGNLLSEYMALATKDIEVRKINLSTQRPESLTLYLKDLHPKIKTLKDLPYKDIALRDVVPWDEDMKDHPHVFLMRFKYLGPQGKWPWGPIWNATSTQPICMQMIGSLCEFVPNPAGPWSTWQLSLTSQSS